MKFIVNVEKAASKWLTSSVNNVRNEDCKPSMFAATVTSSVLRCRTEQDDARDAFELARCSNRMRLWPSSLVLEKIPLRNP